MKRPAPDASATMNRHAMLEQEEAHKRQKQKDLDNFRIFAVFNIAYLNLHREKNISAKANQKGKSNLTPIWTLELVKFMQNRGIWSTEQMV